MEKSNAMRIFKMDLREKVQSVWDENIPIVHHTIIEVVTAHGNKIDGQNLLSTMQTFCDKMDLHVVKVEHHQFEPQGISAVFVLEESHLAIHSWPEKGYVHIDMVTCTKEETNLIRSLAIVEELLGKCDVRIIGLNY